MAVKIQTIDESFEDNGIKMLIYGPAGIGKTLLCATANKPTLIINCEAGLLSILNAVENGFITKEQYSNLRTVKITNIEELREVHRMLLNREFPCEWVMLDSITEIGEVVLEYAKKNDKDPRASYGKLIESMTRLVKDFRDLPHYNVVMTCKQELVADSFTGITKHAPSMPGAKLGPSLPYLFDEVFAMRDLLVDIGDGKTENRRVLHTSRDVQFEAKDRSGCLKLHEPANIAHIAKKIMKAVKVDSVDDTRLGEILDESEKSRIDEVETVEGSTEENVEISSEDISDKES